MGLTREVSFEYTGRELTYLNVDFCCNLDRHPPEGTKITLSWDEKIEIKPGQVWKSVEGNLYTVIFDTFEDRYGLLNANFEVTIAVSINRVDMTQYLNDFFTWVRDV